MLKNTVLKIISFLTFTAILAVSCKKKDAPLPDNLLNFETAVLGIASAENSVTVTLKLSRPASAVVAAEVRLTLQNLAYNSEFTTNPDASSGKMNLVIPAGSSETSFSVIKKPGILFDGDEKILFEIISSGPSVLSGATKQLTVSFAELFINSSTAVINGGGATYPNKVFIDLSANRQTPVARTAWDLGFYTGTNNFHVILNSSCAMMAKQINANDLNAVTAADTVGLSELVAFNQVNPNPLSLPFIDYPTGDLTRTAISQIAAIPADNKVYILNRGLGIGIPAPQRGWKKIRIIRNANEGYTLQHADISATSYNSVTISKDDSAYFFKYVSLESGIVTVEPQKKKWDIAWTHFSNVTNFGSGEVPYLFQDIILSNRNVQVAKVLVASKPFSDFGESDIAAQVFSSAQTAIGSDWRSGGGPTTQPAVRTDRYYIIRDSDNNYYKLRFTALTQNSERGYPAYEVVLLKKG